MEQENSPKAGTPEHDEAMIKLADERMGGENVSTETTEQEGEQVSHEKPEGVADKYWNAETGVVDYASMQRELEYFQKKASGKTEEKPEAKPEEASKEEAEKVLESKGLNMEEFSEEFTATGELSQDSYEKLRDAGIPQEMVDAYIAGQQAVAQLQRAEILSPIGGEEEFASMTNWMSGNLSPEEIAEYNEQAGSENTTTVKNAIVNMYSRFQESVGVSGEMLSGNESNSDYSGFNTRSEMTEAINDTRYGRDKLYTKQVEERIGKTKNEVFG